MRLSKTKGASYVARLDVREATARDWYSVLLHDFAVSRQKWLIDEYLDGRINEKQFLEALLLQAGAS
jgi:hypothetical protein